ncbi:MAG: hypothetical protein ACREIV_15910 [Planctomycetaceae bacterium]
MKKPGFEEKAGLRSPSKKLAQSPKKDVASGSDRYNEGWKVWWASTVVPMTHRVGLAIHGGEECRAKEGGVSAS